MNKKLIYLTLLGGLLILLLAACSQGTPEPAATQENQPTSTLLAVPIATILPEPTVKEQVFVPAFEETACPFDVPEGAAVSCGFVVVPEDHFNLDGKTIRIAVLIRSSSWLADLAKRPWPMPPRWPPF
jgi:hypothetical protein